MSWVAIAVVAAGAIVSATAAIQQGRIAEAQGKFQADVAQRNQEQAAITAQINEQIATRNRKALERQGIAEQEAAAFDAKRIARQQKIVQASQVAGAAKSGVGLAGASLNVLADTAFQFSLDRNLALRAGQIRKNELFGRGALVEYEGFLGARQSLFDADIGAAAGQFAKSTGKAQKRASYISATGSILSAAGSAMSMGGGGGGKGGPSQTSGGPTPTSRNR